MITPKGEAMSKSWLDWLRTASHEDVVMTLVEDGSTLEAIQNELKQISSRPEGSAWQPIETAPKGSWPDGPDDTRDLAYVAPPHLWLLLPDGQRCVGSFDSYYAEGGNGYDGESPWVEEFSGERVNPTHWQPLPSPPTEADKP